MIIDPQVEFQTEGQSIRPKNTHPRPVKEPMRPSITLFTDGSLQSTDDKASWAFLIKNEEEQVIEKKKRVNVRVQLKPRKLQPF